ncbi:hypothetical protein GQX73_g7972 [Xylaria multiplex]|uniref:Beta-lactamase-related domain-containing protein n=1 Tax=Xylaria multiplex TaxID=323545 RepID=A0A7C8N3D2_9PEZI|nr:hypothetical protein GQX73_g7972 [Xylaria multiplex]
MTTSYQNQSLLGPKEALSSKRARIREICRISGVVGRSIAVVDHGEIVSQDTIGYRNLAEREPVTSDTIFHITSLTKSFTGACVDILRGQGKLSFDDPVQKHLRRVKTRDPATTANATIANLLGHRTGLQNPIGIWLGAHGKIKATGLPYHIFLQENILDPLGMTCTVVDKSTRFLDDMSSAYGVTDNGLPSNVPLPEISAKSAMGPASSLMSTANDLVIYCKALMRSWHAQNGEHVETGETGANEAVFSDVKWLFASLQIMETPTAREKRLCCWMV